MPSARPTDQNARVQTWADPDSGPTPVAGRRAGPRVGVYRPAGPRRRHDLRPLATFEIVDQATAFWRRRLGTVATVTIVATVPVQALSALACRTQHTCSGLRPGLLSAALGGDGHSDLLVLTLLALAAALSAQVAATAIAHIVASERLGYDLGAWAALRLALRRSAAVGAAWLLGHLLLVVSAITVVGPLAVMALLLVTTPAIAIEGIGPVAGLRRSWRLGLRRFWPLLGVALSAGLVATLLAVALALLPTLLSLGGPLQRWTWLLRGAASQLQVLVSVPLTAAAATLAYLDVRVRTEGVDLQVDANAAFASEPGVGEGDRVALVG